MIVMSMLVLLMMMMMFPTSGSVRRVECPAYCQKN